LTGADLRAEGGTFEAGCNAGETLHKVVAVAYEAECEGVVLESRAGVDLASGALLRVVEKFRKGDIEGQVTALDFEIDADQVRRAAFGKVLADSAVVQFVADFAGEGFEGGDIAILADQAIEAVADVGREGGVFFDVDACEGDALDPVALIDVVFSGCAKQFLVRKERCSEKESQCDR